MRARLGAFGFGQDKALLPVGELSGGERARLNLALVTHDAPSLLILDEPTNHLDMETREALVAALDEYAGAVVLVSHDWHLVELVADRLWLVEGGTVRPFDGDLEDYRRRLLERDEPPARASAMARANGGDPRRSGASRRGRAAGGAGAAAQEVASGRGSRRRGSPPNSGHSIRKLAAPGAFGGRGAGAHRSTQASRRAGAPDRRSRGGMGRGRKRNRAHDAGLSASTISAIRKWCKKRALARLDAANGRSGLAGGAV